MSLIQNKRNRDGRRGQSAVEFGVAVPFLLLFALTGFAIGMMFDRYLTVVQFNRNAGNMFARGVDFTLQSNVDTLMTSASGLNINSGGTGQGALFLVLVEKVPMGEGFVNEGKIVWLRYIELGNESVGETKFGTVPPMNPDGTIAIDPFNDPDAEVMLFPTTLKTAMRDGDRLFASEMLYEPIELGFSPYIGIDMIHTRAFF